MKTLSRIIFILFFSINLFAVTITSPDTFTQPEGEITVGIVVSDDKNAEFSIISGDDQDLFTITTTADSSNSYGELKFNSVTDFEHPDDENKDNIYTITVKSKNDMWQSDTQDITIIVEDVNTDLTLSLTSSDDQVIVGQSFDYTLKAINNGPDSAEDIKIIDALPDGVTFNSATGTDWYCTANSGIVTCDYDLNLESGTDSSDITINVTAPDTDGNVTNFANVSSATNSDLISDNDTVEVTTEVLNNATDLSISITASPTPNVSTTDTITYTITVENLGVNTAAEVRVEDLIPDDLGFISITDGNDGNTWSCSTSNYVICDYVANGGNLAVGSGGTITIVTRAPNTVMTIENNASITHGSIDTDTTNNTTSSSVNIVAGNSSEGEEPFTKYLQYNIFGEMTTITGVNINKPSGDDDNNYNDNINMRYVGRTSNNLFNSSSATLSIDDRYEVLWAGLYWQGRARDGNCRWDDSKFDDYDDAIGHIGEVLFDAGSGSSLLNANRLNSFDRVAGNTVYGAFADVTQQVKTNGSGTYSVANIVSCEGTGGGGNYGGWTMLVIYQHPDLGFKNVSVFNGFEYVDDVDHPSEVFINGFVTPTSGDINSNIAYFGADGDPVDGGSAKTQVGNTGDFSSINGDTNLLNSQRNVGTTTTGSRTYGIDSDFIDVSNYIVNGQNEVTFLFDAGVSDKRDYYTLNMFAFSTDMFTPIIDGMDKTASVGGLPASENSTLSPGDTITYNIHFENNGTGETATEVEVFDDFDYDGLFNVFDFTATPLVTLNPNNGECGYDAVEHKVWCKLDSVAQGEAYDMSFSLTIRDDFSESNRSVTNTAYSRYKNETTGDPVIRVDTTNGKFGGSSNSHNAGTIVLSDKPTYQNDYTCGIFESVLTSYESITSNANHDQACYTDTISYPDGELSGDITCNPSGCGGGESCERVDPPINKYSHNFPTNSKIGQVENAPPSTLTALEYGDISYNGGSVHFNPNVTYNNDDTKVMLLGDATFSQTLISFEPGDYYFESFNITKNKNDASNFDLPNGGVVRIFIKGNLSLELNNLYMNTGGTKDGSSGTPNDLFIYVNGNFTNPGNGGGDTMMKAFIYTENAVELSNNSNNWKIWGGITAEGPITIDGNNPDFIQNGDAGDFGLGDCIMCYAPPQGPNGINFFGMGFCSPFTPCDQYIPVRNLDDEPLDDVIIVELQKSLFSGSWGSHYAVVDKDGNEVPGSSASKSSEHYLDLPMDFGLGIKNGSITYDAGDDYPSYDPNQDYYQMHKETTFSMSIAEFNDLLFLGSYTDSEGRHYNLELEACEEAVNPPQSYVTGPFDAWDIEHDNVLYPPNDRNISTKVVNKPFRVSLASLNRTNDGYETKNGVGSDIEVAVYSMDAPTVSISTSILFDANTTAHIPYSDYLTINRATKHAMLAFNICSTFEDNTYTMYPNNQCTTTSPDCNSTTATPTWHICPATDPFAVRPDVFNISAPALRDLELLTASRDENLTLVAQEYGSSNPSYDYNITTAKDDLIISKTTYDRDDNVVTLEGSLTYALSDFDIEDGRAINGAGINFSDVGKVKIRIIDDTWSNIDSVDPLAPADCTETGRWICGEVNATFIPDHFTFSNTKIYNSNNDNFTYFSNDLNESAKLGFTLTAQGDDGQPTKNFTQGSWENPVDINYSVAQINSTNANKDEIDTTGNLGFASGALTIPWNETNSTKMLRFNYPRTVNTAVNPVMLDGLTEVTVQATSRYTALISGVTKDIVGAGVADKNVTFVYGRTNAPRQRFMAPVGATAGNPAIDLIFFEVFCSSCTRELLPNGTDSNTSDNPRWFINTKHSSTAHGQVFDIIQKTTGTTYVSATNGNIVGNGISNTDLVYGGGRNYPYKTTMDANASSWLIYDKYNVNSKRNEFEVEFDGGSGAWVGKKEATPSSTQRDGADKTNRRSMW